MIDEQELRAFFDARVKHVQEVKKDLFKHPLLVALLGAINKNELSPRLKKETFYWTIMCYLSADHMARQAEGVPDGVLRLFLNQFALNMCAFQNTLFSDFEDLMSAVVAKKDE